MKKFAPLLAGFVLFPLIAAHSAFAQSPDALTGSSVSSDDSPRAEIQAVISGPEDVAVGRTIVLDASFSRTNGQNLRYQWFIEGQAQPIIEDVQVVYTPEKPGAATFRLVVRATAPDGTEITDEVRRVVTAYNRKVVLVADDSVQPEKLEAHRQTASGAGIFLRIIKPPFAAATPLGGEEQLAQLLSEQKAALGGANAIVLWTEGITGLQALMRAVQGDEELLTGIQSQNIVLITNDSLQTIARVARGPYSELLPQQILVTRAEALNPLLTAATTEEFLAQITQRDIDFQRIDESTAGIRPWNLLSSLVNAMLTRGVPSQTVILLLVLPVIAMILAFLKQVVGITTFGLYTPSIIALSFLALGWPIGVLFLLFILLTGYGTRAAMRRWRLLYIPKVAVIITVVSITLLILMGISAYLDVTFSRETIFILLIMSTLAESFLNMKTEQGLTSAILGIGETVLAALICVFIVQWNVFQSLILAYPELILLTIIVDVILGRWSGLRLVEYFRFREVFKHMQEEE
jgi:hypothetical protein